MNKIEWPLNEPIETTSSFWTAKVFFQDSAGILGGIVKSADGVSKAAIWNNKGAGFQEIPDLIPPKPKVRTAVIYKPITREDIEGAIAAGQPYIAEGAYAVIALLKEHGIECEGESDG